SAPSPPRTGGRGGAAWPARGSNRRPCARNSNRPERRTSAFPPPRRLPSTTDAENESHDRPHDLVRQHKEIADSENDGYEPMHDRIGQQEKHHGDRDHHGGGLNVAPIIHRRLHQPPPTPRTRVTTMRMT